MLFPFDSSFISFSFFLLRSLVSIILGWVGGDNWKECWEAAKGKSLSNLIDDAPTVDN